jgi:hypothetical protein
LIVQKAGRILPPAFLLLNRWQGGDPALRSATSGLLEAEKTFRKVKGER